MALTPLLHKVESGWECRCGQEIVGWQDAELHAFLQHNCIRDKIATAMTGDIYNLDECTLEDLRAGGLL